MDLATYLHAERGRAASLARKLAIAPAYLSQMANGVRPVPPETAVAIERETGQVHRWHTRARDWHRIWPELIGTEGAPPVPEPAAVMQEAA